MTKKTVLLPAAVGLVLLAVYGIGYYSPLKLLAPSRNHPRQAPVTALGAGKQPAIVIKKIPPRPETGVQQSDVPQPLIVLKEVIAEHKAAPVEQNKMAEAGATAQEKAPALPPAGHLPVKKSASASVPPDAASGTIQPQTESISVESQAHLPYSILLSSCRLPQSARKIVAVHQKAGLAPYVVKVQFENGDVWLRVLAGHYPTRAEALKVKKNRQLSDAIVKKTPYANLIGSFSAEAEASGSLKRLKDSGYSPYVLKRAEGEFQVVVGAFITREGAEKQKSELQSKGIPNEIIER